MDSSFSLAGFNSAMEYCRELTMLRRYLHEARINENWERVFRLLESYYIALTPRIKDKKKQEEYKEKYQTALLSFHAIMKAKEIRTKYIDTKHLSVLKQWEIDLRFIEDKLGLLMKEAGDPSYAIGQGSF